MYLSVQPVSVADGDGRVAALFGQPHHVQHGQAQTFLLGLVAQRDGNSAVQEVAAPLQDETDIHRHRDASEVASIRADVVTQRPAVFACCGNITQYRLRHG